MSDGDAQPFILRLFLGIACAAGGLFPILAAYDIGPLRASSINGPPWIGVAAGSVFLACAMFFWFHGVALRHAWLGSVFAFAIVGALSALANWIAFGPGTRECSGTFRLAIFTSVRWVAGLECRIAFGIGATMCNGLLLVIAGKGLTQAGVTNPLPAVFDKLGSGLLLLALGPLLLLAIGAKLVQQGVSRCWARITSPKPRHE